MRYSPDEVACHFINVTTIQCKSEKPRAFQRSELLGRKALETNAAIIVIATFGPPSQCGIIAKIIFTTGSQQSNNDPIVINKFASLFFFFFRGSCISKQRRTSAVRSVSEKKKKKTHGKKFYFWDRGERVENGECGIPVGQFKLFQIVKENLKSTKKDNETFWNIPSL
jgi:hypothetical protein